MTLTGQDITNYNEKSGESRKLIEWAKNIVVMM